jgi:integrase
MREKLTQDTLRRLTKVRPATTTDVYDIKERGLVLRLRASGAHTWRVLLARGRWYTLATLDDVKTPEEARALASGIKGDVAKAKALGAPDPIATRLRADREQAPTFASFLDAHYEPWATANRRTGAEQTVRLRALFGLTLNTKRLDQITAFDVERWRTARLKAGKAAATVNRDLSVLKSALRLAVRWKLLATYPLADVRPARVDTAGRVRFLSPDEETRLRTALAARDDTRRAERDSANRWRRERGYVEWPALAGYSDHLTPLVLLAINTGLRRGELFNLRWQDVDRVRNILTVEGVTSKSGQSRHVPLNTEALRVLHTWQGPDTPDPSAYVFASFEGARLDDIKSGWLPLIKAATVTAFTFHDLRHTFASKLVMAGVDLNTVRELLGHSDIKMTLRYAHLAPEHKAAAVAKLLVSR